MRTLTNLFAKQQPISGEQPPLSGEQRPIPGDQPEVPAVVVPTVPDRPASEVWAELGLRLGGENEVLRNLLIDVGRRVEDLDELKRSFERLAPPIDQALQKLERETFDNIALNGTLKELRTSYETLRADFRELGTKLMMSENDCERLREELTSSQEVIAVLESRTTDLTNELDKIRPNLEKVERQLAREIAAVRILETHKQSLTDQLGDAEQRIADLQSAAEAARENLVLQEDENGSLRSSLDQLNGENSRLLRRVAEEQTALENTRRQLEQMQPVLQTTEAERARLAGALAEANARYQSETNALGTRLEAMASRAKIAEKLLAEVRQNLAARGEESSAAERKAVEANVARSVADKRAEVAQTALEAKERQVGELERRELELVERSNALQKTVEQRDMALSQAEKRIQGLHVRLGRLKAEIDGQQSKAAESIAELKTQVERERAERSLAEGALRKARAGYGQPMRDADDHASHDRAVTLNIRDRLQARPGSKDAPVGYPSAADRLAQLKNQRPEARMPDRSAADESDE